MATLALGSTFGVFYVFLVLASILYGVSCVQAFLYFTSARSSRDHGAVKFLVIWMLFLDTFHEACLIHSVYWYLVDNWGVPEGLGFAVWSLQVSVYINSVATFTTQCIQLLDMEIVQAVIVMADLIAVRTFFNLPAVLAIKPSRTYSD
ncbi:uncharacterized protein STEHIDRAFT_161217 [Stereum hirsutum FP-91666 SS1]|uniref:uncharacterized protein n=1 Tax=Stereum hirsutum (strain FP-91666) TaxID=721885 RepID=UPI000444A137|nr:uncharacterized protein STEHIDRAFT_161217 [Stereum hirsutum FP-91666 SS1]EIM81863.1 hypothetical protein STEHIDRAFT_161217 [Stereum hirsutum FP-91666 SS1]